MNETSAVMTRPSLTIDSNVPHVAHVRSVTGFGGGPDKTILNTPRVLRSFGYSATCVYLHPPGDSGFDTLVERARAANAPLIAIPDYGPLDWRVIRQLVRVCREQRIAIWHGHDYKSDALGLIVRQFVPLKLATTLHGWVRNTSRMPLYNAIDRWSIRRYEQVMCVSAALRDECLAMGVPAGRCHLIRNGIDVSAYGQQESRSESRQRLGIADGRFLVGAVGRLSPEKGFDRLIRAVNDLTRQGHPIDLLIAGEGAERAALTQLIQQQKAESFVRLIGHLPDPRSFFHACDAFVLSSLSEGLPNVVLEAMACSVPVIATEVGELSAVIDSEVDGLLVPPDSPAALADSLRRLLADESLRTRLGESGRMKVESSFTFDRRIEQEAAVYDRLLGRAQGREAAPVSLMSEAHS